MLLSAYENDSWKDASLNWIEETEENAVEVIATRSDGATVAIEHTLIEPFVGERYDSTIFTEAFAYRTKKNPDLVFPERALEVSVPAGGLPPGYDRDAVGEELLAWLKANHRAAPEGDSTHVVMVGASSKPMRNGTRPCCRTGTISILGRWGMQMNSHTTCAAKVIIYSVTRHMNFHRSHLR
jgi:hypothetical protein